MSDIYLVRPLEKPVNASITVPGSKSYTHRMLIAAALSDGKCTIDNALDSEDTRLTANALELMGASMRREGACIVVEGNGGRLKAVDSHIDLNNSGTSMRLLSAVAALGETPYTLTGSKRMQLRPIQDLIDSLKQIGVSAHAIANNGCPPIEISGPPERGGAVEVNCELSSQFLSALMLIAPYVPGGLDINVKSGPVSRPYVDITVEVMQAFGIHIERSEYDRFHIPGNQNYQNGTYSVEPDASQAGYFYAAAALTGSTVKVAGINERSVQGDTGLMKLLAEMGCHVDKGPTGIAVSGGNLKSIEIDMADMPDVVPTVAVVAAYAEGTTRLCNVGHLAVKESNRLEAVINELNRMSIAARLDGQDLIIPGGNPTGANIETYDDHRIAMSFAIAGLRTPGVCIKDPGCVAKSFPRFWEAFETLNR